MKAYIYNDEKGDNITVTDDLGDMADQAAEYRTELIEKICELDDDLMMQYLEGEEPSVDDMKKVLRKGTCECTAVPVCCGSAYRNKGVQKLLDAIIEYMPAPTDIPAIKGVDLDGNEIERHSSDDEPFAALAFKIMADPFVGKLAYFRVYSGTCKSGSYAFSHSPNVSLDPDVYVHPALCNVREVSAGRFGIAHRAPGTLWRYACLECAWHDAECIIGRWLHSDVRSFHTEWHHHGVTNQWIAQDGNGTSPICGGRGAATLSPYPDDFRHHHTRIVSRLHGNRNRQRCATPVGNGHCLWADVRDACLHVCASGVLLLSRKPCFNQKEE